MFYAFAVNGEAVLAGSSFKEVLNSLTDMSLDDPGGFSSDFTTEKGKANFLIVDFENKEAKFIRISLEPTVTFIEAD